MDRFGKVLTVDYEVVQATDRVALPNDLQKGEYDLAIGIVGENSTEPVVRPAVKGRASDGWYPLSKLLISERATIERHSTTSAAVREEIASSLRSSQ